MTVRNAASMGTYGSTWQAYGYAGQGNVKELIDSIKSRSVIIAGGSASVFEDIHLAEQKLTNPLYFAVNDVGMFLPKVDHWVSLHGDFLRAWRDVRWQQSRPGEKLQLHSDMQHAYIEWYWQQLTPTFALSGYFAMQIAYIMGADLIVLCGCPGSAERRFFEYAPKDNFGYGSGSEGNDKGVREQVTDEMQRLPDFKAKVRSMSGWTKYYFGSL